jgi:hypothetical protein
LKSTTARGIAVLGGEKGKNAEARRGAIRGRLVLIANSDRTVIRLDGALSYFRNNPKKG